MKLYKHVGIRGIVIVKAENEVQAIDLIREALDSLGITEEDIDLPVEMVDIQGEPSIIFMIKKK